MLISRHYAVIFITVGALLPMGTRGEAMGNNPIRKTVTLAEGVSWVYGDGKMEQLHISGEPWSVEAKQHWQIRLNQYLNTHKTLSADLIKSLQAYIVEPGMTEEQVLTIWGEPIQRERVTGGERWRYGPYYPVSGYELYFEGTSVVRIERISKDPL